MVNKKFWKGKKVLITGHTGFKGAWLSMYLKKLGAEICGVSLPPPTNPSLYELLDLKSKMKNEITDIRNTKKLNNVFIEFQPEIVFHLAAQPLVGLSYTYPVETYDVNLMGTLHILEAIRHTHSVRSAVMITTDKCYNNKEWVWGYREEDELGGHDPYSSSKAAAEILIKSYRDSYFKNTERNIAIASARAGNVIGGGDWADDRLIPDIFKSMFNKETLELRNLNAVRPWQHVLDPLTGYLILAKELYQNHIEFTGAWNFGPDYKQTKNVGEIVQFIQNNSSEKLSINVSNGKYKETTFLKLDSTKSNTRLHWYPVWNLNQCLEKTIEWYLAYREGKDMVEITENQIEEFVASSNIL